jgi:small subunit ribosomal protein S17
MPARKSDAAGTPAKKASAARKPAAKKAAGGKSAAKSAAARKPAAKKPAAKKPAAKKPVAAPVAARKPVKVKAPRPAPARVPGRKERRGVVVSSAMDKTIVVRIDAVRAHDKYGKVVRRSSKLHAHDESNVAGVGDVVRIVETRPLSATKHWRLLEVLAKAK